MEHRIAALGKNDIRRSVYDRLGECGYEYGDQRGDCDA
jgi:hypothetical protein